MSHTSTTKLSPRQQETLHYLLLGEGEKRIAFLLGISVNTVHTHVQVIYRKFEVHSRYELMRAVPPFRPAELGCDWQPCDFEVSC